MEADRSTARSVLRFSLLPGAAYFLLVAVVHQFQWKVPGLYIYFDVPSFAYQDMIISALAFGWAAFFVLGFVLAGTGRFRLVWLQLSAGLVALATLVRVNTIGELRVFVDDLTRPYWIQAGVLGLYLAELVVVYALALQDQRRSS
jgi:hypothetical protein